MQRRMISRRPIRAAHTSNQLLFIPARASASNEIPQTVGGIRGMQLARRARRAGCLPRIWLCAGANLWLRLGAAARWQYAFVGAPSEQKHFQWTVCALKLIIAACSNESRKALKWIFKLLILKIIKKNMFLRARCMSTAILRCAYWSARTHNETERCPDKLSSDLIILEQSAQRMCACSTVIRILIGFGCLMWESAPHPSDRRETFPAPRAHSG